jgi:hypothetical protein
MIRMAIALAVTAFVAPIAIKAPANIAAIVHQAETAGRW